MIYFFLFVLGAVIGSFLNVVIFRLPRGESIVYPASHCQTCKKPLKFWHNVPIVSWLALRGRCAFCGAPISPQYPLIELLSGLIFVTIFLKMGVAAATLGIALVFLLLLALSMIDFYHKAVPDSINLLALTLAVFSVYSPQMLAENFVNAVLLAGGFTLLRFYLSYYLYARTKAFVKPQKMASWMKNYNVMPLYFEAMGEADIIIAATMGALLGVKLALVAVFLSALLALPAMIALRNETDESKQVPFIPFLAMATWIVYVFDSPIATMLAGLYA
jgi:leader peptidase (prepilin peptidase)/N-methyltransferase